MLSTRELRTILASLLMWRQCGHRTSLHTLYWGVANTHDDALTDAELDKLISAYRREILRLEKDTHVED